MKTALLAFFVSFSVFAHTPVRLWDVAVMGFASHDMFEWDAENEVNKENGRLDLSNLFDHPEKSWQKGGNPKNAQNAAVWSFTMHLKSKYQELLKHGAREEDARVELNEYFHSLLKESFTRLTGKSFPTVGVNQKVTNLEQAAMRGIHDILPAKIKLYRKIPFPKEFDLTKALLAKTKLNMKELMQEIPFYDGKYDEAYDHVKIPFTKKVISLTKIDGAFIAKHSPWTQEQMLAELARVAAGDLALGDVFFMDNIYELFSKGICPIGSMPKVACQI